MPLFNRAIQGQYPPGSTIKPVMGMAGLESGLVTPETTVPDPGWYRLPGDSHRYRDWILRIRGTGHAPQVDLKMAIAESCDTYFYLLTDPLKNQECRMAFVHVPHCGRMAQFSESYGLNILVDLRVFPVEELFSFLACETFNHIYGQ